ncbi:MAG: JAB domain-containing protein [Rhodocyclaceae bacterium]|nr:JAB domain-containing protein [Rhodocyclaceae bacterium]
MIDSTPIRQDCIVTPVWFRLVRLRFNPRQCRLVERALKTLESSAIYRAEFFRGPGVVLDYLRLKLAALEHEVFVALWLDTQNRLIEVGELSIGTLAQTSVYPREVVKAAGQLLICSAQLLIATYRQ